MVKNDEKLDEQRNNLSFMLSYVIFLSNAWKNVKFLGLALSVQTSQARSTYVAEVYVASWASLFLLFIGKVRSNMSAPRGAQIQGNKYSCCTGVDRTAMQSFLGLLLFAEFWMAPKPSSVQYVLTTGQFPLKTMCVLQQKKRKQYVLTAGQFPLKTMCVLQQKKRKQYVLTSGQFPLKTTCVLQQKKRKQYVLTSGHFPLKTMCVL